MELKQQSAREWAIQQVAAAVEAGDIDKARILSNTYRDLINAVPPKLDTGRIAASPINQPFANLK